MSRIALALAVLLLAGAAQAQTAPAKPAATATRPAPAAPAGGPQAQVEKTFDAWDRNHDGVLSREEFRTGWTELQRTLVLEARLRQRFNALDADHSGALEPAEYATIELVKRAGKNAPPLARFDANKDGKLEFVEYVQLVQALAPQAGKDAKDTP